MNSPEMRALLQAARDGDNDACTRLLEENAGLIWSIVRRYLRRGLDPDDLYQLGCLGFLKAVRGFDLAFGTQFSTYAVPKIAGEIRRFLRDDGMVKVGRGMKETAAAIARARAALSSSGVQVGLRNISVSDRMALHRMPAISGVISTPCSPYIWYKMVAVQPTGTLRK